MPPTPRETGMPMQIASSCSYRPSAIAEPLKITMQLTSANSSAFSRISLVKEHQRQLPLAGV